MNIGLFSDIHGNHLALKNCLQFFEQKEIADLYFLGDAVGYLPWGAEVLDLLMQKNITCIKGNHDAMLLGELPLDAKADGVYKLSKQREHLSIEHIDFMKSWPLHEELSEVGLNIRLIHGSPKNELLEYVYPDTDLSRFDDLNMASCYVMAHTHRPFIKVHQQAIWVNVGSVGLPRDVGNLSSVAILNTLTRNVTIYRITMDIHEVVRLGGQEIHESVISCLQRESDHFVGERVQ